MPYASTTEVRETATQMTIGTKTADSPTLVSNETLLEMIERASRIFDLTCGAKPEHFESAYYAVWKSSHVYVVGEIVTPATRNSHKYTVTTGGTSGTSQPTFPTSSSGTVTSGTVVFTESGADVVATARTFYGDGTNYLKLDPYVEGSLSATITLPTGLTAPTFVERDGYLVQTASATDGSLIQFAPSIFSGGWSRGVPVTATALWGYDGTPADVKQAVIELTINLWRETDPASSKLVNLDGGILRESLPPRVKEIARRYRVKVQEVAFA